MDFEEPDMRNFLVSQLLRFARCEDGVTLVEYGIAISMAITVGTIALFALGGQINISLGVVGAVMP